MDLELIMKYNAMVESKTPNKYKKFIYENYESKNQNGNLYLERGEIPKYFDKTSVEATDHDEIELATGEQFFWYLNCNMT